MPRSKPKALLWGPPERSVWRAKRAVSFVQKRFGFRQTNAPNLTGQVGEVASSILAPSTKNLTGQVAGVIGLNPIPLTRIGDKKWRTKIANSK
ncbi:MAG: hypothetical protein AUJ32_00115 [Parcubacteria group bacterium CG1_02_40_82]|uniref:Uncharacterized protein n=1 Tax=Candidatus Portnoybacteria bacterium CG_4_8_14_3_um_filter_40_10 TaxID=1974801 RepID=A0A2M7IJE2_9BACT|nr:MAG: hypothetical protein AUJ32_00115 [Parcubacteria group bacterium CG1_02_40_82]PIW76656.1 MAG: hypothetical protein CO001_00170 [Candidatus Portnoybacteria bacterium CG_4_8_14_3_um_filter_40_10]